MPQGSIIGPILFNINVNDVADHITDCLLVQYADDTQFLHTSTVDNLNLLIRNTESTLLKLKRYFLTNGLLLNPAKLSVYSSEAANYYPLSHPTLEFPLTGTASTPALT